MNEAHGLALGPAVALLAAAVVAAPIFLRLGLGSVLGYLAAGIIIGPFGPLDLFRDPGAIRSVAELGVVMFLFLIGLEMRPAKLWALRREIFGLGLAHVAVCGALLTLVGLAYGLAPAAAFVAAMGFVLSSTAVIMKMLDDKGETSAPAGQRAVSILLFEDLAIVPLLAIVAVLASATGVAAPDARPLWQSIGVGIIAIAAVFVSGRWLLNPLFALLARSGAREVLAAAALLVVLGAALFMQWGGLSMAMGAFLAGVLLSESSFRHQLEADVEPFRGILLGLFFMSVGMSLDLRVVLGSWPIIAAGVLMFMTVQGFGAYAVARLFGAERREAAQRGALFSQGGEFAFVLYGAALSAGIIDARLSATMTAVVVLSMALAPIVVMAQRRLTPSAKQSLAGVDQAEDLQGRVLFIGFGRFGQVVSQALLARGIEVSLIETDVEMIRAAGNFGFKVYYGDGTRLDVLRASGAATAEAILICVDKPDVADRIVTLAKAEFPHAKLFARAYDRGHSLRLAKAGVDFQIRETFESALAFSGAVLLDLGIGENEVAETIEDVRQRDAERFALQIAAGLAAGRYLIRNNQQTPKPTPYITPAQKGEAINVEALSVITEEAVP